MDFPIFAVIPIIAIFVILGIVSRQKRTLIITPANLMTASKEYMELWTPFQPRGWLGWSRIAAGLAGQLGARDTVLQPNSTSRPPSRIADPVWIGPTPATPSVGCRPPRTIAEVMIKTEFFNSRGLAKRAMELSIFILRFH